ncbi:hypothetical protein AB0C96_04260 [Streptomyces sp. NPDC048506]|uniref:hypothetical protein n=1 Tax=Streptomyces sp. NPDC048506 TaxID=3155028 RepID=UPI003434BA6E
MTGHDWWHNASLRTTAAVGEGWRLFRQVYLPSQYDGALLAELRRARLAQALTRAARTTHFAPHLTEGRITPEKAEAVLESLPVLEKDVLRHTPEALTTGIVEAWDELRVHTSGTTGEPVRIIHDDSKLSESTAANLRMLDAYGLRPGLRVIRATADLRHGPVDFETMPYFGAAGVLRINVSTAAARDAGFLARLLTEDRGLRSGQLAVTEFQRGGHGEVVRVRLGESLPLVGEPAHQVRHRPGRAGCQAGGGEADRQRQMGAAGDEPYDIGFFLGDPVPSCDAADQGKRLLGAELGQLDV